MNPVGSLEGTLKILNFRLPRRFFYPFLMILVIRAVGGAALYQFLNTGSSGTYWMDAERVLPLEQNEILTGSVNRTSRLSYLFLGWDSAWYLSIATRGYFSDQSYAFLPGFPFVGWVVSLLLGDPILSLILGSALFGVLWVPLYQAVAEFYMDKRSAFASTLLFALSPFVFMFTSVAYSEGLFLFLTLSAWYCFEKKRMHYAVAFASMATVVRWVGLLMVIPMLLKSLSERRPHKLRRALYSLLPSVSLLLWLGYCGLTSGDWFASAHTSEWSEMRTFSAYLVDLSKQGVRALLLGNPWLNQSWISTIFTWTLIIITPFLIRRLRRIDKPLSVYSSIYYLSVLAFGTVLSFSRFISFLFPVWMQDMSSILDKKWSAYLLALVIALFLVVGFHLWASFLDGVFVG